MLALNCPLELHQLCISSTYIIHDILSSVYALSNSHLMYIILLLLNILKAVQHSFMKK